MIGAGIAGLSTAHALGPTPSSSQSGINTVLPTVECFDGRPALDTNLGAGIQLNGGLAVLGKINPAVMRAVMAAGMPAKQVRSRAKPWSDTKTFETLLELDLLKTVRAAGGGAAEELVQQDGQLLWYSIMRGALQETLYETLPEETRRRVQFGKTLTDIVTNADCNGLTLKFSDGTESGPFDVVIGCDGVKSAVKEYIEVGKISRDAAQREGAAAALYSGVRIRYAVKDGDPSEPQAPSATLSQYFGNGAYALDGTYGAGAGVPNAKASFIVYLDDEYYGPFKKSKEPNNAKKSDGPIVGENADWTQDVLMAAGRAKENMLEQIRESGIPGADLAPTIMNADRFFDFGVYFHNPFSFTGWSKEIANSDGSLAVLCGDAAHAFPPFLGQGSNQAIQDAYCLAKKVHQYNAQVERGDNDVPELKELFKEYEKTRWPATFEITLKSAFLGYLETGGPGGVYAKFRDVFFKTMGVIGVAEKVLISAATPKV